MLRAIPFFVAGVTVAAADVPLLPLPNAAGNVSIPRILLGTGG